MDSSDTLSAKSEKVTSNRAQIKAKTNLFGSTTGFYGNISPKESAKPSYAQSVLNNGMASPPDRTQTEDLSRMSALKRAPTMGPMSGLESPKIKFVSEKDWKMDQVNCWVCERPFDKLKGVFTHHCRICGNTICGDCSKREIEKNRACDVCYLKDRDKEAELQRKEVINTMEETVKNYARELENRKGELQDIEKANHDLDDQMKSEDNEHISVIDKLKNILEKNKEELSKKLDNNERLRQISKSEKELHNEKMNELDKIEKMMKQLRLEVAQKKSLFDAKNAEFTRLKEQQDIYERSMRNSVLEQQ
jgi:hypothetical protein